MGKLNQIIAVVQGKKTRIRKFLGDVHQGWKNDKLTGISRSYVPKNDDGDMFPPESIAVRLHVDSAIAGVAEKLEDFFNVVATQEYGNTVAKGDIVIDGETIVKDVPVSALLFLEKQLIDLRTFAASLPVLSSDKVWKLDDTKGCYVTEAIETVKTQKQHKPLVLYPATEQHPAQTQLITEDVVIGNWETIHMSGALPAEQRTKMVVRIEALQDAVKKAREQANSLEVTDQTQFGKILAYAFGE